MSVELAEGKAHLIVKRDGREQAYDESKMYKVALWATGSDVLAKLLLESLHIRINNRMKISVLFEEMIDAAVSNISALYPHWDKVAMKLYSLKIYKETWGLSLLSDYPMFQDVISLGIQRKVYDPKVYDTFTPEEIKELGEYINPDRDLLFSYKGLHIMFDKYCMSRSKTKKLELPQHVYMRCAMFDFYKEPQRTRMTLIKDMYDTLSEEHSVTLATPHSLNAGTPNAQIASCVLSQVDDNIESISDIDANMAIYSKFSGGLAVDVTHIRASGSPVKGNRGMSGGPIPFIKKFEATVASFDQGGARKGSCNVTYQWWHYDVEDLIMLKDPGGTEDKRARKLKYTMQMHNILKTRVKAGKPITLFCPSEVPELLTMYGAEFEAHYLALEKRGGLRKRVIDSREFMYQFARQRQQTGNIYIAFVDNINLQNVTNRFVGSSNLCTEITVPCRASKHLHNKTVTDLESGLTHIVSTKLAGEIGLCNLASFNLLVWWHANKEKRMKIVRTIMRAMDNVITNQFYPAEEARYSNLKHRPIGLGVLNYASVLASVGVKMSDDESLLLTHQIFEELSYAVLTVSVELARERGAYEGFRTSNWAKGILPVDLSLLPESSGLKFPLTCNWEKLREDIMTYGVRFSLHMAIAPTATSGKAINATESTEPVPSTFYVEEGTTSLPTLANNLQAHRMYYENGYTVGNKRILDRAAIRQRFWDQAASINTYYPKPESAREMCDDIWYAMDLGIKTLYYLKTPKSEVDLEICSSCT
jgi:ribonucleoside-diphosphate reductase alpha chain